MTENFQRQRILMKPLKPTYLRHFNFCSTAFPIYRRFQPLLGFPRNPHPPHFIPGNASVPIRIRIGFLIRPASEGCCPSSAVISVPETPVSRTNYGIRGFPADPLEREHLFPAWRGNFLRGGCAGDELYARNLIKRWGDGGGSINFVVEWSQAIGIICCRRVWQS